MSATIGTEENLTISFKALLLSLSGIDTLTKSPPSLTIESICLIVALVLVVSVFVIDCTDIGLSPPIFTLPTLITFVFFLLIFLKGLISIYLSNLNSL